MVKNKLIETLIIMIRIILGLVFVLSGFVKAVDPLGSAYKFNDYFSAFGIEFLAPITLLLAIVLSCTELVIGFSLLTALRMRWISRIALVFMLSFTLLTLYLAIENPVSDCGCFGDAFKLTNWQTFWKNLILLTFSIIVFKSWNGLKTLHKSRSEWIVVLVLLAFALSFSLYNLRNLPILDFRPYSVGSNIQEKMAIPDGAPKSEFDMLFIYEKDDLQKEFSSESIPWDDTTWKWKETKIDLIKRGYTPPIFNFDITSLDDVDITDQVLEDPGYSFLLISHDLNTADQRGIEKAKGIAQFAQINQMPFYCLTASLNEEILRLKKELQLGFDFYTTDNITLKTIIRSNPGLLLIKEGTIIGKWHYRNFPKPKQLRFENLLSQRIENQVRNTDILLIMSYSEGLFLIAILISIGMRKDILF